MAAISSGKFHINFRLKVRLSTNNFTLMYFLRIISRTFTNYVLAAAYTTLRALHQFRGILNRLVFLRKSNAATTPILQAAVTPHGNIQINIKRLLLGGKKYSFQTLLRSGYKNIQFMNRLRNIIWCWKTLVKLNK